MLICFSAKPTHWQKPNAKYAALVLVVILLFSYQLASKNNFRLEAANLLHVNTKRARSLSPNELMSRPLLGKRTDIPKLIHQSWSSDQLPGKFSQWSSTCRETHPDWEWVLWTDQDNLNLVKRFMPSMLSTYESLNGPIFRADIVRNAYMLLFGGVYADLDVECLRGSDDLFKGYNVSTMSWQDLQSRDEMVLDAQDLTPQSERKAQKCFFGRMGTEDRFEHSIPNAWMASTPGHVFFRLMLQRVKEAVVSGKKLDDRPEAVTGPIALREGIQQFERNLDRGSAELQHEEILANPLPSNGLLSPAVVELLPFQSIYPYSWARDGEGFRGVCSAERESFDAHRCKDLIAVDHWPSYAITYWSHTWTWQGHDEGNVDRISK